jgi:DNA-binding NarL/FixJ family response regulator
MWERTQADPAPQRWDVAVKPRSLRLLVVTDVRFLGEALAAVLERELSVSMVTCATVAETVALRFTAHADAVLIDAAHCDGTGTVRRLREVAPQLPIIACAIRETDEDVVLWAEAGVTGYLPNNIKLAQIGSRVTGILDGQQVCSARAAAALLRRVAAAGQFGTDADPPSAVRDLTRRERQIAELIAAGLGDKQIARELNISVSTTKTHVHNLLGKLHLRQRGDVAEVLLRGNDTGQPPGRIALGSKPEISTPSLVEAPC